MFSTKKLFVISALGTAIFAGCGEVEETAAEVRNDLQLPGHWLMVESDHSNKIEKAIEKESMVLTFKDDKAAFSPTDSVKGQAVYAAISECTAGPRTYKTDGKDIVFPAENNCAEKRVTVERLDGDRLKFPDPEDPDTTRTFIKISDEKYNQLVKASDRKP